LAIIAVFIWQLLFHKEKVQISPYTHSIAVLPFNDLSPQKDQEIQCEGMAETLITSLSQIENLFVPARTSAFSFKGSEKDYQEIGEKLNVETVLVGSIQKAGSQLRIAARIVNVSDGSQLWANSYRGEEGEIFNIQDQISLEVVDNLKVSLLGEERSKLTKRHTENFEAYTLYMQGQSLWHKRGPLDLQKAIEYFQEAIKLDPGYALAYVGIADAYLILADNLFVSSNDVISKIEAAIQKAFEIDNNSALALGARAKLKMWIYWDFSGAEIDFKKAIDIQPGNGFVHHSYAFLLSYFERHDEAVREMNIARNLDPLAPRTRANAGLIYCFAQQYDKAVEVLEKEIESYPQHFATYGYLGWTYMMLEEYDKAIEAMDQAIKILGGHHRGLLEKVNILARQGRKEEARTLFNKIMEETKEEFIPPTVLAAVYGALGDYDEAFESLEKAYKARSPQLCYLRIFPNFWPLRLDPRYNQMLEKVGLVK
jgi:TolB-like protein/Tfp pilus assembly protein PilF